MFLGGRRISGKLKVPPPPASEIKLKALIYVAKNVVYLEFLLKHKMF
jgi:hypothetical protein